MRTIKFRAQGLASNKWLYGDLRHIKDDVCIFEYGGTKGEQVEADTIGQYTGFNDFNGNEIYEGDFLDEKDGTRHLVEWDGDSAGFYLFEGNIYGERYACATFMDFEDVAFKIVGNIHDNPELA